MMRICRRRERPSRSTNAYCAARVKAARIGRGYSEVIEEALRRDLGLDLLERAWENADLGEDEALSRAVEAQHQARLT